MRTLALLFFLSISQIALAQFHVHITDETSGVRLPDVLVQVRLDNGEVCSNSTGNKGSFYLNCQLSSDSLLFVSAAGFRSDSFDIRKLIHPGTRCVEIKVLRDKSKELWCAPVLPPKLIQFNDEGASIHKKTMAYSRSYVCGSTVSVSSSYTNEIHFRGSRSDAQLVLLDGMKVRGELNIPLSAINSAQVYNNGTPACFGDVTGTVISIELKGYRNVLDERGEYCFPCGHFTMRTH